MLNEDYRQRTQRYIELLQRQKDTIFRLCLRRARLHPDRVNDLMQEVYVRLAQSRHAAGGCRQRHQETHRPTKIT